MILLTCDQKLTKSQCSPTHAQLKEDNGRTKTTQSGTESMKTRDGVLEDWP